MSRIKYKGKSIEEDKIIDISAGLSVEFSFFDKDKDVLECTFYETKYKNEYVNNNDKNYFEVSVEVYKNGYNMSIINPQRMKSKQFTAIKRFINNLEVDFPRDSAELAKEIYDKIMLIRGSDMNVECQLNVCDIVDIATELVDSLSN